MFNELLEKLLGGIKESNKSKINSSKKEKLPDLSITFNDLEIGDSFWWAEEADRYEKTDDFEVKNLRTNKVHKLSDGAFGVWEIEKGKSKKKRAWD